MRVVSVVLDGAGLGGAPDAAAYGDAGADTLGHVVAQERPHLPHLAALGLGRVVPALGTPALGTPALGTPEAPRASWARLTETAAGKDSTTGHWELAGLPLATPFPTYPEGFPDEVIAAFCREAGVEGVLANVPASGTAVIAAHGEAHQATGYPIVYTSADSVFQIAAHVDAVPLERLYAMARAARERVCVGEHAVGRVIARPFEGAPGAYERLSHARRDFSLPPPGPTVLDALQAAGVRTVAVGKIGALFDGRGFDAALKTSGNADGLARTLDMLGDAGGPPTFVWTNLVDFDELYGHRNDAPGFARALEAFDAALPALCAALAEDEALLITADHGNDPTFPGTDHTRERVPLLLYRPGRPGRALGDGIFSDHAATVAALFGVPYAGPGRSLLR
ncbi:MAG: phosphopentomutase [Rubricoccaceae bacterium]